MLLTDEVIETAHKLLDVRGWKDRISTYDALKIAVEIQRNELLREVFNPKTLNGEGQATQRINLLEQVSRSFADIAYALREKNI